MKRVSQYRVDVIIDECDLGLEELIAEALERFGIDVALVSFNDDVTRHYKDYLED